MNIALDWDDTYTRDPELWHHFIEDLKERGHNIYLVTARSPTQRDAAMDYFHMIYNVPLCFTSLTPKRHYMNEKGIIIDVWIDDMPEMIV